MICPKNQTGFSLLLIPVIVAVVIAAGAFMVFTSRNQKPPATTTSDLTPTNELPMFGNKPFTEEQKKLNDQLVSNLVKETGSKQAAVEEAIKLAWQYIYKDDPKTAMKRFNQGWLLDPNNDEVFYGFAYLMSIQEKADEAILLYKKALELNPNHPMALANLARSYKDKAYNLYVEKGGRGILDQEVKNILSQAFPLYEKASQTAISGSELRLTSLEDDLSYIYYQWAVALEFNSEYAKAWEKVKLSRKYGGNKIIEEGFLKELSQFMPEPK